MWRMSNAQALIFIAAVVVMGARAAGGALLLIRGCSC
jgi:hypothetical protein